MLMGIEDKIICLCLNKRWQPIGVKSVRDAFSELVHPNCVALNVIYKKNKDESLDFSEVEDIQAVKWEDWIKLPVRECDLEIRTSKMSIRVPTIIASSKYSEIPTKRFRPTKRNIWLRDNGICQYSGKKLKPEEANIDHPFPKSRGGPNTWENMVLCHKDINSKKGSKTPEEAGLKLIRKPKPMSPKLMSDSIEFKNHIDWSVFLK
jgi:5-methylcytosine-specific restriction endonuclease McrA